MKERDKNNKLIATFMGSTFEKTEKGILVKNETPFEGSLDYCLLDKLEYQSSWDWLMPVIEKIESIREKTDYKFLLEGYTVKIYGGGCTIESVLNNPGLAPRKYSNSVWLGNKLESTYVAVVEFIKQYKN